VRHQLLDERIAFLVIAVHVAAKQDLHVGELNPVSQLEAGAGTCFFVKSHTTFFRDQPVFVSAPSSTTTPSGLQPCMEIAQLGLGVELFEVLCPPASNRDELGTQLEEIRANRREGKPSKRRSGPMKSPTAAVLRFAAPTALFWVSLTLVVEGRIGLSEETAAPAFHELTTNPADAPEGPSREAPEAPTGPSRQAPPDRPALLSPLYVSFATLQVLDIHSTLRAPSFGAREGNPLVAVLLASPVALVASKAAITTGLIYASEGLRKRHPRAAVLMMIGLNSAYALVVAHNYVTEARARTR
jgi:hypothetical protein